MSILYKPLQWPTDWIREHRNNEESSPYHAPFTSVLEGLKRCLVQMQARQVVLTSNMPLLRGRPDIYQLNYLFCGKRSIHTLRRLQSKIGDSGVALYFRRNGQNQVLACDRWETFLDNMQSISITLDSLRKIEQAGAKQLTDRIFSGFAALGSGAKENAPWNAVLGIEEDATEQEIKAAYRSKAKQAHPDMGGTNEAMRAVVQAYQEAMNQL